MRPTDLPRQRTARRAVDPDELDAPEAVEVHVPDRAPAVPDIPRPRRGR
ncbi:hypothetical protein ACQEVB_26915 [Pseudonocardia sp. CA-107938]